MKIFSKWIGVALLLAICLIGTLVLTACSDDEETYTYTPLDVTVRYLNNIEGETGTLSSSRTFIGENTLYLVQDAKTGEPVTKPEDPKRTGFVFAGWYDNPEGDGEPFDFSKPIEGSMNLYAKWTRAEGAVNSDDYAGDPTIPFNGEKIVAEGDAFSLLRVCNQPVKSGKVELTTAGINRLTAKSENVKEFLVFNRLSSTEIVSMKYQSADSKVVVTYKAAGSQQTQEVLVQDVTDNKRYVDDKNTKMDEASFEIKAQKYEKTDFIDHASGKVILAGSSSMENWSTSTEVMDPVTTLNFGIGGSASFQWTAKLADRLIIPYSPRAVVLYVGINDIINYGKTGQQTAKNLIALFEHIHECLPDTVIHFILINHVPGYYTYIDPETGEYKDTSKKFNTEAIDYANEQVILYAEEEGHEFLNIIDAGQYLEKKNGEYSEAYFLIDGLHMSQSGYLLWGAEVRRAVIAKDKEIYYHG